MKHLYVTAEEKNSFIYLFNSSSGLDCLHGMRGGEIMKCLKCFFGDTFFLFLFDEITEQFQVKSNIDSTDTNLALIQNIQSGWFK